MPRRRTDRQRKPASPVPQSSSTEARGTGELSPLDYMLSIVRDPSADPARRDRMAICCAQYCHPRAGDKGKKDAEAEAAREAGGREWGDDLAADDWP